MLRSVIYLISLFFLLNENPQNEQHKFYVSVTDASYNEKNQRIEMISRVFIDDFEDVINLRYGTNFVFEKGAESEEKEKYIAAYLEKKLKFVVENKEYPITYLGKKFDVDQIKLFIEVNYIPNFDKIEVTNLVLTDLYDTQKNLFHLKHKGKTKSTVLMKDKSKALLKF